jgi:hypothetical protein
MNGREPLNRCGAEQVSDDVDEGDHRRSARPTTRRTARWTLLPAKAGAEGTGFVVVGVVGLARGRVARGVAHGPGEAYASGPVIFPRLTVAPDHRCGRTAGR